MIHKETINALDALIDSARHLLHSEMSISQPTLMTFGHDSRVQPPEQEGVEIKVEVRNDAAPTESGGEVVFIGVGLRITDGGQQPGNPPRWMSGIQKSRPHDHPELRQRHDKGAWFGGKERFRAVTSNEESFGEVLFPGENVLYEMPVPTVALPYIDIEVEGSVSRRHLLHFVQNLEGLEQWAKPALIETFSALNAVQIHRPLTTALNALPDFGPRTTLEEITAFREALTEAVDIHASTIEALNRLLPTTTKKEVHDHLTGAVGRQYLRGVKESCEAMLAAISSGDTQEMIDSAAALKQQQVASENVDAATLQLMSRLKAAGPHPSG